MTNDHKNDGSEVAYLDKIVLFGCQLVETLAVPLHSILLSGPMCPGPGVAPPLLVGTLVASAPGCHKP